MIVFIINFIELGRLNSNPEVRIKTVSRMCNSAIIPVSIISTGLSIKLTFVLFMKILSFGA